MAIKNTKKWETPKIENLGKLVDMTKAASPGDTKDTGSFDGERFAGQNIGSG